MSSVVAYRELDQLDQLRLAWNALLGETDEATLFQTLEWYQFSLRTLRPNWRPCVLVAKSLGKPIGILPLCIEETRTRWGTLRKLVPPPATEGASFRPIGRQVTATIVTVARFLRQHPRWWDVAEWTGIERQGWDRGRTEDAFANAGIRWNSNGQRLVARERLADPEHGQPPAGTEIGCFGSRPSTEVAARGGNWSTVELRPVAARFGDGDPQWPWFDRWINEIAWEHLTINIPTDLDPRIFLEQLHSFASERGVGKILVVRHKEVAVGFQYQLIWDGAVIVAAEGQQADSAGRRNRVFQEVIHQEVCDSGRRDGDRWIEFPIEETGQVKPMQEMIVRQSYRGCSRPGWSHMWRWLKSG